MKPYALAFATWAWVGGGTAFAAVPTIDAAQLTQRSQTYGTTVQLVPITTKRQDANDGVKCAVTTGKKASVSDPTVQPQTGAGGRAIQAYAPDMPAAPRAEARGATLNSQTLFKSTGDVVASGEASKSTLIAAQSAFQKATSEVGTATTVMAAIDMNSAARLQNTLAWNGVTSSANSWVTAANALNLARNSDMSQASIGMRSYSSSATGQAAHTCPTGMIGTGTLADPCRRTITCSTSPPGSPADPACSSPRYVDSDANVQSYLASVQAEPASATPQSPRSGANLSAASARTHTDAQ